MGLSSATLQPNDALLQGARYSPPPRGLLADEERPHFRGLPDPGLRRGHASPTLTGDWQGCVLDGLARQTGKLPFDAHDPALLALLSARIGVLEYEILLMIFLDGRRNYICDEVVIIGGQNRIEGRYRLLVQRALHNGAASLLLVHNHPSGDPQPSQQDIQFTLALKALARALDIELADHLVVTRFAAFSIKLGKRV